jgi:hypothetical protein
LRQPLLDADPETLFSESLNLVGGIVQQRQRFAFLLCP